jgi:hypothetical protein
MQKGDWVIHLRTGYIGFVVKANDEDIRVHFTLDNNAKNINGELWLDVVELIPAPDWSIPDEKDFDSLIELALSTKDYDWCNELVGRMREGVK